jgi:DivIVA domain-containing protein
MNFPLASAKLQGYDPKQVDALMARVSSQQDSPDREILSSAVVAVAKFDLVKGGYQIPAVDEAIARVADIFEIRELERALRLQGKAKASTDLAALLRLLKQVLETDPKERFEKTPQGYNPRLVNSLVKRIEIKRSTLVGPTTFELRTISLGRSSSGYDRGQVDEFLSAVVSAMHRQDLLG